MKLGVTSPSCKHHLTINLLNYLTYWKQLSVCLVPLLEMPKLILIDFTSSIDSNFRLEIETIDSRIDSFGITVNTTPTVIWLMLQIRASTFSRFFKHQQQTILGI